MTERVMFVGGPMHGQECPAQLAEQKFQWIECVINEFGSFTMVRYVLTDWFVGVGKPTRPVYVLEGVQIDDLIELARPVMTC